VLGRTHHAQIDILRGACSVEAKLEGQTALQRDRVSEHRDDSSEEAIKTRS